MDFNSKERIQVRRMCRYTDDEGTFEEEVISIAHQFPSVYNGFEGDDEVFIESEELKSPDNRTRSSPGRVRRISDVIDSMGDESPRPFTSCPPRAHTSPNLTGPQPQAFFPPDFSSLVPPSPMTPRSDQGYSSPSAINSPLGMKWFQSTTESASNLFLKSTTFDTTDANPASVETTIETTSMYVKQHVSAVAPVDRESREYNMNHKYRGVGLILNHRQFKDGCQPDRDGTEKDVERLYLMYKNLDLETKVLNDPDIKSIMLELKRIAAEDHSDRDCLVVSILTHGNFNNRLWAYDHPYQISDVWNFFSPEFCASLAGKPKIFFIQACRGSSTDAGITLVSRRFSQTDSANESYTIPRMADFFTAHSTPEGYFSWRHPENGTWFIKALSEVINAEHETSDLTTMMLRVTQKVAIEYQSVNEFCPWRDQMKQVPCTTSTLMRQVFFRKKN